MNSKTVTFCILFLIYLVCSLVLFNFLHKIQPTPLIDEVFHIPQGLKYCNGNFSEWNPKITTLPGLYVVSFGLLRFAEILSSCSQCSAYNLKLINVVCSSFNLILIYSIYSFINNEKKSRNYKWALWTAFNISILPVSFFFNFFYYTDTMSTFFVLLMYRVHLAKHYWVAAAIGCCSVMTRQTNIIWVGYILFDLVKEIPKIVPIKRRNSISDDFLKLILISKLSKWKEQKVVSHIFQLLRNSVGYLLVCASFLLFVIINKGIVVGDKTAHKPVVHLCQIFYFSLFTLIFCFPHFIEKIGSFFLLANNNKRGTLLIIIMSFFIVYYNTMVHPYLLSDNRHYSFYIWKRVYEKHFSIRYILLPIYFFVIYCMNLSLVKNNNIEYWLCSILCLVPQKLLEFRYFLLPFILFRLQLRCKTWWHLFAETFFYVIINVVTIYIFSTKEFYWSDSNEIQRIIW